MALYFANTEITGIKDLFPLSSKDITGLYFGDTELFTVWATYDGTLPATYSANGIALADYCIYGASGGVGNRTENLFDVSLIEQGGWSAENGTIPIKTLPRDNYYNERTRYKQIIPLLATTMSLYCPSNVKINYVWIDANGYSLGGSGFQRNGSHATAPEQAVSMTFILGIENDIQCTPSDFHDINIVAGSTAPAEYVPYGYVVPMSVSDGSTATTTQIYIGSDPLGEDEYVDYVEQKVYRMSGGILTPTDPPVPLPTLPTVNGTTITDYAGQSAAVPSRFVAKYRKEGFN